MLKKTKKTLLLILCLVFAVMATGPAAANQSDLEFRLEQRLKELEGNELLELQWQIDRYVFYENAGKIAEAGFTVTHTAPVDGVVEIGILPFSEEKAEFLYEIFGWDKVKVVEGIQAILLPAAEQGIAVEINGNILEIDVAPFIEDGRTLVPLRGVMEALGARVEYNQQTRSIKVVAENITIELQVGSDLATVTRTVNGVPAAESIKLDVPATIDRERTFIPVRFMAETLGFGVNWNADRQTVVISGTLSEDTGEIGPSLAEAGLAIPVEKVKDMTLYSLMQEKLKTFSPEETGEIISALNNGPTYTGAYILVLVGNSITITMENDDVIKLTSFGSKDHVVLSGLIEGKQVSACIIAPEVAAILLSDAAV